MAERLHEGEQIFRGIAVSAGVSRSRALVLDQPRYVHALRTLSEAEVAGEMDRFERALMQTRHQLHEVQRQLIESVGAEQGSIFDAHLLVLEDPMLIDEVVKVIREKQVNIFGTAATYRLVCEGPEEQSESVEKYFDSVVASFVPFAGRTITSAAEGNSAFVAAESHYQPASYTTTTYYIKEGLCPTCGRNFGAITGWEFGPTIIRCKDCRTVIDAHDQWKDWLSLPAGTKTRLVFINVGIPIMGILVILAFMLAIAPDVQNWELPILLGIGLLLFMVVVFVFIPFFRRVSESKKLSKENRIPEW